MSGAEKQAAVAAAIRAKHEKALATEAFAAQLRSSKAAAAQQKALAKEAKAQKQALEREAAAAERRQSKSSAPSAKGGHCKPAKECREKSKA
jgi:hypothetical protein